MKRDSAHRSRTDILFSILKFIYSEGEAKKTHILYATNLNTKSLDKFLKYLNSIGAVDTIFNDGAKRYVVTPYGRHLLDLMNKLQKALDNKPSAVDLYSSSLLNKLSLILNPKNTNKSKIKIKKESIRGYSGLLYNVDTLENEESKYIIITIDHYMSPADVVNALAQAILYLMDTSSKCIILNNLGDRELSITIEKLFNRIGLDNDRYVLVSLNK